jgi:hypothetical protein
VLIAKDGPEQGRAQTGEWLELKLSAQIEREEKPAVRIVLDVTFART